VARYLAISDLHFGAEGAVLRLPAARERLAAELEWAEALVINGDLFTLVTAPLAAAVEASRPFFELVAAHVRQVVYVPGNHDHHLVALAGDESRLDHILGLPGAGLFRLATAERILKSLLGAGVEVRTGYPLLELDGVRHTHGHYIAPHQGSFGWRLVDTLAWRIAGEKRRQHGLGVAEYEALIAPLYELMYETAQLPAAARAQEQTERLLTIAATLVRAPSRAGRQILRLVGSELGRSDDPLQTIFSLPTPAEAAAAMEWVCENLQIPAGPVVFGHTHVPFVEQPSPRRGKWIFHNCGSWYYDRRQARNPRYRQLAWPGSVLRLADGRAELRELLADWQRPELEKALYSSRPRRRLRRRLRLRRG
jgi:hypothetical protein